MMILRIDTVESVKASVKIVVKSDSDLHKALDRMVQILETLWSDCREDSMKTTQKERP